VCQTFSARGRPGGAGPLNVKLGPPDISETTRARKLKLQITLDMVNYPLWVQKLLSPTKEEVNAFARVRLSVCLLALSKITQKRVHGFG